jgi:pimeloyl-ACP methyl ester carboxylesterase
MRALLYRPRRVYEALPTVPYEIFNCGVSGWFVPAEGTVVVLYCHGNSGNIGSHSDLIEFLQKLGLSICLFDYQGYGLSPGKPTEAGCYADADRVWQYLTLERGIAVGSILLYGHSLGAAVATWLAGQHPEAAGLIMEGAFTSLVDAARARPCYRWLPLKYLITDTFPTAQYIQQLKLPVALLHGLEDGVVPFAQGEQLYLLAPQPKRFYPLMKGHERLWEALGTEGMRELLGWFGLNR